MMCNIQCRESLQVGILIALSGPILFTRGLEKLSFLFYIVPSYTMLYYTILYYTILYYTILYYTILYYTILYYTILYYTILYYTILYYTILYYTILYYTILYYTILYYTILYYTILYYTILYYTILYYTIPYSTLLYYTKIFLHRVMAYYTTNTSHLQVPQLQAPRTRTQPRGGRSKRRPRTVGDGSIMHSLRSCCYHVISYKPKNPKYLTYRVFRASILGIVTMVLGRYLIVRYLDPLGNVLSYHIVAWHIILSHIGEILIQSELQLRSLRRWGDYRERYTA